MPNDLNLHPRGQVSVAGGPLKKATMANCRLSNGATLRHSLAQSPSGVSFGNRECSFTIEMEVPSTGYEYDILSKVDEQNIVDVQFKDAQGRFTVQGAFSEATWDATTEGVVKITGNGIGKFIKT